MRRVLFAVACLVLLSAPDSDCNEGPMWANELQPARLQVDIVGLGSVLAETDGRALEVECTQDSSTTCAVGLDASFKGSVILVAEPDAGWEFDFWDGDCHEHALLEITSVRFGGRGSDRRLHCVATFRGQATLEVQVTGPGTVLDALGAAEAIACDEAGGDCTDTLDVGAVIPLQAVPDDGGARFVGWGGDCAGADPEECTVTFAEPTTYTVTATFAEEGDDNVPISLAAGQDATYVVRTKDLVVVGRNEEGQVGSGSVLEEVADPTVIAFSFPAAPTGVFSGAVSSHGVAIVPSTARAVGSVYVFGRNSNGQLGLDDATTRYEPTLLTGVRASAASTAQTLTCLVLESGGAACAGSNGQGQLGNGDITSSDTFVAVGSLTGVTSIAATLNAACAVHGTGAVSCWGNNGLGQLGNGATSNTAHPDPVATSITDAVQVAGASWRFCAVHSNGDVSCWGDGYGSTPTVVSLPDDAVEVGVGEGSIHALLDNGEVWSFFPDGPGTNLYGQFGDGSVGDDGTVPVKAAFAGAVSDIAVGYEHLCAIVGEEVWCVGRNSWSQLGIGSYDEDPHPTPQKFQLPPP